jgi:hypothetical protein
MSIHAIIPAAGQALRLRRLPKFLLPAGDDAKTLIERHIELLEQHCDVVWIPVRPDLIPLVHDLNLGQRVIPVALATQSMTETVLRVTSTSGADKFILGMPDTAFIGEMPYPFLFRDLTSSNLSLALWHTSEQQKGKVGAINLVDGRVVDSIDKDLSSNFQLHWGAMAFDRKFVDLLSPEMPHTGYGIRSAIENELRIGTAVMAGRYFDCGTFSEYKRFLNDAEF